MRPAPFLLAFASLNSLAAATASALPGTSPGPPSAGSSNFPQSNPIDLLRLRYSQPDANYSTVGKKATNAEINLRVNTVYGWLCHGWQRHKIQQEGQPLWNVNESRIDVYIRRARELIDKDCEMSRQAFLAEAIDRLRNYEQIAAQRGQMQVATNSVRLQAELIGLTQK